MSTSNGTDPPPPPYHRRHSNHDLQVPMTDVQRMSMEDEERPLPDGWIRQFDRASAHHFYVDTHTNPTRSIWVHPYDDEQYQREHGITPQQREGSTSPVPPPSPGGKLHKKTDAPPSPSNRAGAAPPSPSAAGPSNQEHKDRGFFGKLKDKAIGTKEEREAAKQKRLAEEREMQKRYLERRKILLEQQRAQDAAMQQYYARTGPLGGVGYRYGSNYAAPTMAFGRRGYGYDPYGGGGYGYGGRGFGGGGFGGGGFGGLGGGGLGLPLLAGLGGGILGADLASNAFDGGGYGGGGFDGGGGGFDGGGGGFDGGGGGGGF